MVALFFMASMGLSFAQQDQSLGGGQINLAQNIETAIIAEPLNGRVNTPFIEYGPTLTKDGKRLYFSRQGFAGNVGGVEDEDIWFSIFDEATQDWLEAKNIGPPLNTEGPNFVCGVGVNGDTILLGNVYSKRGKMKAGLSLSIKEGDTWSFPQPVAIRNDYNLSERASFDVSNDRKALLIAQRKVDSHGGLDLYVALRNSESKYPYAAKESINLGPVINSVGDETSPFLAYDNKTLYFASNGHNGYGKFDIFVSRRLDDTWTNWTKPENLGAGINTPFDDTFFGFTPRSRYAYYSRGLTPTNTDIYRLDMTYLFKPSSKPLDQMDELIDAAQVGQSLVLDSVFLDDNYEMRPESMRKMRYILSYMKFFRNYRILITAHSNKHDSRDISHVLSVARAVKVVDFLVGNGIDRDRLEFQGYGHDVVVNMDNLPTLKSMKSRVASSVEFRLIGYTAGSQTTFR